MKIIKTFFAMLLILTLFVPVYLNCGDDDDDDDSSTPGTEDDDDDLMDDDDDVTDDDDVSDDDDDDDNTETIILDDGEEDYGISASILEAGDARVQGFTPSAYPVILKSFTIHVGSEGEENQVRPVVYYSTSKGMPPDTFVYAGEAMTLSGWEWNDIDLSGVTELESNPITSGEFWVGLQCVGSGGITMHVDEEGTPDDNMWLWDDSESTWYNYASEYDYYGVFMLRPTIEMVSR